MGNVHKTIVHTTTVRQILNPKFKIAPIEKVNDLNRFLKDNGIETAQVLRQTKGKRILERLNGDFYNMFTKIQRKKAMLFLRKLHDVLDRYGKRKPINQFYLVSEFSSGDELIWGDTKASNLLWRNGELVGIVDYDTVSLGSVWYDVFMALATWGVNSHKEMEELICLYLGCKDVSNVGWEGFFRKFILLKIKEITTNAFGLGYFIPKSRDYYKKRIKELNSLYEKSFNRRGI